MGARAGICLALLLAQAALSQAPCEAQAKAPPCEMAWQAVLCAVERADGDCIALPEYAQDVPRNLKRVYDRAPWIVQRAMCDLDQITIRLGQDDDASFAGRAAMFEQRLWFSWDGLVARNMTMAAQIKRAHSVYRSGGTERSFVDGQDLRVALPGTRRRVGLDDLVAHEVAHLIDAHMLSMPAMHCLGAAEPPSALIRAGQSSCYRQLRPDLKLSSLQQLSEAGFVTPYAVCNPEEEFAELFAKTVLHDHLGYDYALLQGEDEILRLSSQLAQNAPRAAVVRALLAVTNQAELDAAAFDHLLCQGAFAP